MPESWDETKTGGTSPDVESTRISLLLAAADPASPSHREALSALVRRYWKPVYFFIRRSGVAIEDAKDLTQDFFVAFLRRQLPAKFDPARGRFRTFLLTAVRNFLHDAHDSVSAQKRGGDRSVVAMDLPGIGDAAWSVPVPEHLEPDALFHRQWAAVVLQQAMRELAVQYDRLGRNDEFRIFERYAERMSAGEGAGYDRLAGEFEVPESTLTNVLHRARQRFRALVLGILGEYTSGSEEAEQEAAELFGSPGF